MINISICAIYDNDIEYTKKLTRALNDRRIIPYEVVAFSNYSSIISQIDDIKIVIINKDVSDIAQLSDDVNVIFLTEELEDREDYVYKYQPIDEIVRCMERLANVKKPQAKSQGCQLIGVYSPCNSVGRTAYALDMALKAGSDKVLLISLDEFSGFSKWLHREIKGSIADNMYYYLEGNKDYVIKLNDVIVKYEGVDIVDSPPCKEDLTDISVDEYIKYILEISQTCEYDMIILDMGNVVREEWKLFKILDTIHIIGDDDELSLAKISDLKAFLGKVFDDLLSKKIVVNAYRGKV